MKDPNWKGEGGSRQGDTWKCHSKKKIESQVVRDSGVSSRMVGMRGRWLRTRPDKMASQSPPKILAVWTSWIQWMTLCLRKAGSEIFFSQTLELFLVEDDRNSSSVAEPFSECNFPPILRAIQSVLNVWTLVHRWCGRAWHFCQLSSLSLWLERVARCRPLRQYSKRQSQTC